MKKILPLVVSIACLIGCDKDANNTSPTPNPAAGAVCFKESFIKTQLPESFSAVFFLNAQVGFIAGSNGSIYKTTNAAVSWTKLNSTTSLPLYGVCFIDNNTGFAVGGESSCGGTGCTPAGGFILRTQNGGQSWTKVFTPTQKIALNSVYFLNATTGYSVGGGTIAKTTDGGQTWTETQFSNVGGIMMKVGFVNDQTGFVICLFDKILRTTNGGASWTITSPNTKWGYYAISSANGVSYVSGQDKIIKSTDNGLSWTQLPNAPRDIYDIKFIDANTGFAFGRGNYSGGDFGHSYGSMYCTSDGGNTWNGSGDYTELRSLIQAVSFPTAKLGYAVSGNTVIKIERN